jgi:hypothetical protein
MTHTVTAKTCTVSPPLARSRIKVVGIGPWRCDQLTLVGFVGNAFVSTFQ